MTDWGERLSGGNVGGAWRVEDTVRRGTGPWSPAVHALLEHLRGRLEGVPAFHGIDEHGREIVDFLPGQIVDVDTEELTNNQLVAVVDWTRRLHQATADFVHPGPWRNFPPPQPTLIGHGDIAPYNVCFDGDTLVGVFDWDMAGPTSVHYELGFIAWNCVPLFRSMPERWCAERLRLVAATYGQVTAMQVLAAVFDRTQASIDGIKHAAEAGDPGMRDLYCQDRRAGTDPTCPASARATTAVTGGVAVGSNNAQEPFGSPSSRH